MDRQAYLRIEREYQKSLKRLFNQIFRSVGKAATPEEFLSRLGQIQNRAEYQALADKLALRLTARIEEQNLKTWRHAARQAGRGSKIYSAIMETVENSSMFHSKVFENAYYIKTAPFDIAKKITKTIGEEGMQGKTTAELTKTVLQLYPEYSEKHAHLIARTESSKTQTALIQSRSLDLGLDWYVWQHSHDQRTRHSHKNMGGVLVRWSHPPAPETLVGQKSEGHYHAGDIYNCRCYPEPLVSLNQVNWPCKVFYGGEIQSMTQAEFKRIAA